MNHTITVFDHICDIRRPSEARTIAEKHRLLLARIEEPQILDCFAWDHLTFWEYENSHPYLSSYYVLNYAYTHKAAQGSMNDFLLSLSAEDEAWTAERNKEYNGIYFRKISFGTELKEIIRAEAERVITEAERVAEEIETAEREEAERKEAERKALLDGVTWTFASRTVIDEGGKTEEYKHTLIVGGETCIIWERSIFDFGTVLNWNDCLLRRRDDRWIAETFDREKGWYEADRQLDENGQRAAQIVCKYGHYANAGIRM